MSNSRIVGLDLLRATAALMVVLAHGGLFFYGLWPQQQALWLFASWGVDLFFVLSGFLIGGMLLRSAGGGGNWIAPFWMRRWLRTLPNYYLFLMVNLLLWRMAAGTWPDFSMHLLFAQNLAWPHPPFFPEAWSLAVEEVFYLLAPLAFAVFGVRRGRPVRSSIVLIAALVLAHVLRWQQIAVFEMPWDEGVKKIAVARVDAILYGVLAALWLSQWAPSRALARALALLTPLALAIAGWLYLEGNANTSTAARLWCFSLSGVGFALLLPICARWEGVRLATGLRIGIQRLALWSFALYLTHLPVMRGFDLLGLARATWPQALALFAAYLVLSITFAALVYRYFESPILSWRDRRFPADFKGPPDGQR